MHGARALVDVRSVHIEQQIAAIESAVASNPGLAFDLAKTLLESACRTVLSERRCTYDDGWELPKLLKETLGQLQLVPASLQADRAVSGSLRKMAGGLQTAIQGICELRNSHGFASHGKDASFQQLDSVQALLVARAADAIVNFLFQVHRGYSLPGPTLGLAYDDHPTFNDYVDEAHGLIRVFEAQFKPSEVLFQIEPETYRVYLAEFEPEALGEEPDTGTEGPGAATR